MDGKNSEKDIWLRYCEECIKSKIDKNTPQDFKEDPGETTDPNL